MRNQRGLTLLEVLVALAVLSAVLGALLMLMAQHTRQASLLEDRMLARIVAENAMASYVAAKRTNRDADLLEDVELSGRAFRFEIKRERAPIQGFETVTTDVRLGRDGQVLATLSTLQPSQVP